MDGRRGNVGEEVIGKRAGGSPSELGLPHADLGLNMDEQSVIDALTEQVACYRRLAKLADVQHEHVQQGRTEELLQVLRSRETVLSQAAGFEEVVGPAKKRWAEFAGSLGSAARANAEMLLAETRRLLELITTADRNDAMVLQQRKLSLGRQIQQAAAARALNRNYAAAAYGKRGPGVDLQR